MITLNLLAPEKKQALRLTELYQTIKNVIILILFLTIIVAIVLLVTKLTLQNHFQKIVDQTSLTNRYVNFFSKDVKEFNKKLKAVESIQSEYVSWTSFFVIFSKLVPDEISLYNITINKNIIFMTGFATTRSQLLKFQTSIENSDLLTDIEIPLENLLKKDDVKFTIKANINLASLKKQ